ncbi:MAG: RNA polymerase sporulation sigma factor SigH [Oscillospiraceae bacterium]|nr:RNA polymerase sporulation sigma factor SigH [Oscillospiraceae bacterium]
MDLYAYNEMSDEAVVALAQRGDEAAMDFILKKYSAAVRITANHYFLVGAEHDDLVQEGMIGLFKAIQSYSPEKSVAFRSFADLCITRNILTAIKGATRQKHLPLNSYVSLDRPVYEEESDLTMMDVVGRKDTVNPEEIVINREKVVFLGDRLAKFLSKLECQVLLYYLRGESYTDIAARLGKDPKAIDNAIQRIRRKLKKIGEAD